MAELWPEMELWLAGKRARGKVTSATAESQRVWLRSFAEFVGPDTPVCAVTADHFELWLGQLRTKTGRDLKPGSRNTVATPVRAFFTWAHRRGMIRADPCCDVERARVPDTPQRALTRDEVARVLAVCPSVMWRDMITVTVALGLRIGDLAAMQVEHWSRADQLLWVRSKGGDEHRLATDGEAGQTLALWIDHGLDGATTGPMWPSSRRPGQNYDRGHIGAMFRKLGKRAGVDMRAHDLRHTTATDLDRSGVPVPVGMKIMRHKSMATYQRYSVASQDETRPVLTARAPFRVRGSGGVHGADGEPGAGDGVELPADEDLEER